jgi:3-methyladenine DNA glycosylase AlkD
MAGTVLTGTSLAELMVELVGRGDLRTREMNEKHGDDHGVNLGKLPAVAKTLKTQQELARDLWETGDTAARLLALLVCRRKAFGGGVSHTMLR